MAHEDHVSHFEPSQTEGEVQHKGLYKILDHLNSKVCNAHYLRQLICNEKAYTSLHIPAVLPELLQCIKNVRNHQVQIKVRHLFPSSWLCMHVLKVSLRQNLSLRFPTRFESDLVGNRKDRFCHKLSFKHACTTRNFGFRKKRHCPFYVAKTKALISCMVTVQLICFFVFA